jgi:hypothetical protein
MRHVYKNVVGKFEENAAIGRHRRRWEDNIKMASREIDLMCKGKVTLSLCFN